MLVIAVLPIFGVWLLEKLIKFAPDYIHATDLHTVFVALLYRTLNRRTMVVYDMFDVLSVFWRGKRLLYTVIRSLEIGAFRHANGVIATSPERLALFTSLGQTNTAIVPNYPQFRLKQNFRHSVGPLLIRYAGGIGDPFLTQQLLASCRGNMEVRLELAGRLVGNATHLRAAITDGHAEYKGILSHSEAMDFVGGADVIPVLYDSSLSLLVSSQKLLEAIMLGVPVVTNVCKDLVLTEDCGLFVRDANPENLRAAFHFLATNPSARHRMAENGRNSARKQYNWEAVVEEITSLYRRLQAQIR
ncbi:MAG TPA: glycosyltransferase [Candidatus Bathyarchaeia archaeon]|nr:glycosyltransferase [Candidatus Bathyarchaeia archaeon]